MDVSLETKIEGEIDFDGMISKLEGLDGRKVDAGLFSGENQKKAMWNEYGTSRGIPARPFLRNTLYENEARFGPYIAPFITNILNGGSGETVLSELGQFMAMSIKRTIAAGGFAPNAPATVAQKGHGKPLVDTGSMYGSIDWRVAK